MNDTFELCINAWSQAHTLEECRRTNYNLRRAFTYIWRNGRIVFPMIDNPTEERALRLMYDAGLSFIGAMIRHSNPSIVAEHNRNRMDRYFPNL